MVIKSANAYKSIKEAAASLELEPHVLRFWESKFDALNPMTRGGGRRFYAPKDMEILVRIKEMLYIEGNTIKAANRLLGSGSAKTTMKPSTGTSPAKTVAPAAPKKIVTPDPQFDLATLAFDLDQLIARAKSDIARLDSFLN